MLNVRTLTVLASVALAPWLAHAQGADEVERGRALFMANGCFSCHGSVGQGGGARSGAPKLAPKPHPFEAFRALIRTPREAMPRYDPQFVSDDQLRSIHVFLSSMQPGPAAKDIGPLQLSAAR